MLFQPGIVSGLVYSTYGGSLVANTTVSELVNGSGALSVQTDANGKFFFFISDLANGGSVFLYTTSGGTYAESTGNAVTANIYNGYLNLISSGGTASALANNLATAVGSNSTALVIAGLSSRIYTLSGTFNFDQTVSASTLIVSTTGTVNQSAAITASNLLLSGTGGTFNLANSGNQIGTLAANTGTIAVNDASPLTVNTVAGVSNIAATGAVTLNADSITLTPSTGGITAPGQIVTLAPNSAAEVIFVGSGGSGLVITPTTIAQISADTLVIGNSLAGALTVNQSIAPNTNNLALVSGGAVTQTTGTITVSGLGVEGSSINLLGSTTATTFASSSTSGPTITVSGDLTIATIGPIDGITWTDSTTATVKAGGNITVSAPITNTGGGNLVLYSDVAGNGGTITFNGAGAVNFASSTGDVTFYAHPVGYPNDTDYIGGGLVTMGTGAFTSWLLVDSVADLQAINNNLNANYALNKNLDASSYSGFQPIGYLGAGNEQDFFGNFDGLNHTISNLTITSDAIYNGLFGQARGTISNLGLVNITVTATGLGDTNQGFGPWVGGLAGWNSGAISNVFVSGSVSSTNVNALQPYIGGLLGEDFGSLSHVYSTASVSAVSTANNGIYMGGVVGYLFDASGSNSLSIDQVYATGYLQVPSSVNSFTGAIVGATADMNSSNPVTNVYWDSSTSNGTSAFGDFTFVIAGSATAALQGSLPTGFDSQWSTGAGLYPYLTAFYPTPPQVVTGFAYSDRGATAAAGAPVTVVASGSTSATATAGANGYFYELLPTGSFSTGSEIVAYTSTGTKGLTYEQSPGAQATNVNIYGGYLTTMTSATRYSDVPALVGNSAAQTIASTLNNIEYDLSATSFDINQTVSLSSKVLVLNTTGAVTESGALNITGSGSGLALIGTGGSFTLNGANNVGTLALNTGTVAFNNGANNVSIGTLGPATGATITGGMTLTDTGTVSQASKISGAVDLLGAGGTYTLTSTTNAITTLAGNTGTLNVTDATGNTLTIGTVNGTVGLTAGGPVTLTSNAITISSPLTASGQAVTIKPTTAIAMALGAGTGSPLLLTQASLSNITAQTLIFGNGSTGGALTVGASVTLPSTLANLILLTGNSTGISVGSTFTLTDGNSGGNVTLEANAITVSAKVLATGTGGSVTILPSTIGENIQICGSGTSRLLLSTTTINNIVATTLTIGSTNHTATVTVSASETLPTGTPTSGSGITNLSLITGNTTTSAITIGGTFTLADSNAGGNITLQANAITITGKVTETGTGGSVTLLPATTSENIQIGGSGTGRLLLATTSITDIAATTLTIGNSGDSGTITVSASETLPIGTPTSGTGITNLSLVTGGGVTISAALTNNNTNGSISLQGGSLAINAALAVSSTTGNVVLSTTGSASQSAAITAAGLDRLGSGGSYWLTPPPNSIGTIAGNTGSVNFSENGSFSIGTVNGTVGVTATGAITLATGGSLTIASSNKVSGTTVVLSALGNFINNEGSDAVTASTRWLIYSSAPGSDTFGNLDSGDSAIWNATFSSLPPVNVTASGNRYIFAFQPTLTVTTTDTLTKTYGDDYTSNVAASAYTITGIQNGITGAFLGDTAAAVYSGAPALSSSGAGTAANASTTPYAITGATGTLLALDGYSSSIVFTNNGTLTVNPATLTFTANSPAQTVYYGDAIPALSGSIIGFKNSQTAANFGGDTWTTLATNTSNAGNYAITGGLTNASPNYTITQAPGNSTALTITPATLTFTANSPAQTVYYGDTIPTLSGSITGFKNSQTAANFGGDTWTTLATNTSNAGNYAITGGLTNASPNYTITQAVGNSTALTITPAPLTFTADPASREFGTANPSFTGTVVGFKNSQTVTSFGGDVWTSPADTTTAPGTAAINGSLANAAPNYTFVQVASNAAALTITGVPPAPANNSGNSSNDPSHVSAPVNFNPPPPPVTITFQGPSLPLTNVSFTPGGGKSGGTNNVNPAALPDGTEFATNNGFIYQPISDLDPNQYSNFKLPDNLDQTGESAIFAMIARGADPQHASDYLIDSFWNGASANWPAGTAGGNVTFSNGAGDNTSPNGNAGFPIVSDSTDFGQMLSKGPVMISNGGQPAQWLLATNLTPDGKGIFANDPISGKQVLLSYDPTTKTVGGVTGIFDSNTKSFVSLGSVGGSPADGSGLQAFVPASFIAVSVSK